MNNVLYTLCRIQYIPHSMQYTRNPFTNIAYVRPHQQSWEISHPTSISLCKFQKSFFSQSLCMMTFISKHVKKHRAALNRFRLQGNLGYVVCNHFKKKSCKSGENVSREGRKPFHQCDPTEFQSFFYIL